MCPRAFFRALDFNGRVLLDVHSTDSATHERRISVEAGEGAEEQIPVMMKEKEKGIVYIVEVIAKQQCRHMARNEWKPISSSLLDLRVRTIKKNTPYCDVQVMFHLRLNPADLPLMSSWLIHV